MKKCILVLLVLTMMIPTIIFAETAGITAHNGITFGMNQEEIQKIELANGFEALDSVLYKGNIAGQEDAVVTFHFNSAENKPASDLGAGGMYWFQYKFKKSTYKTMYDVLTAKYGMPTAIGKENRIKFGFEDDWMDLRYEDISSESGIIKHSNLAQWLIPQGKGSVLICIYEYKVGVPFMGNTLWISDDCIVRYVYVSSEYVTQYNDSQNQLFNDL